MQSNESRCDGKDSCLTHHPRPAAAFASCPRACIHYIQLSSRRPIRYANLSMNKYFSSFHFPSTSGASCRCLAATHPIFPAISSVLSTFDFARLAGPAGPRSGGSKFLPLCKSPKIFLSYSGPDFHGNGVLTRRVESLRGAELSPPTVTMMCSAGTCV